MVARVVRFVPQRERITRDAAAKLADQLRLFPEDQVPASARAQILNALQRVTQPDTEHSIWPGGFVMLSRVQTAAVWKAIRALPSSARPNHVRHAFDLVLLNLRQDTGEVMLTRDQLADEIGCSPDHVSRVMGTLERMGVVRRERRAVEGMRGRGMAVYFINADVAWNGSLEVRKAEAAVQALPLLTIMQGGRE